ncbi:hypothetical protein PSQ90_14410 [Devosia rhodophyticola]|uniref:Uncharacterized protein n=1 Tax=Devosia rhodophyticola TaxID=3026423 RepID=A0ABY7YVY2_9HYPH|nr:DUF6665 family protein [Devosia rhodophyticola]WDR05459.1 hypothetical protein PSQ90_14410 [Devosia rhodophyticola]
MSLRDSLDLIRAVRPEACTAALQNEIAAERASSLGAAERHVVTALEGLGNTESHNRDSALAEARRLVWQYFVQRELVGFRRHTDVIQELKITPEVLAGLGAIQTGKTK